MDSQIYASPQNNRATLERNSWRNSATGKSLSWTSSHSLMSVWYIKCEPRLTSDEWITTFRDWPIFTGLYKLQSDNPMRSSKKRTGDRLSRSILAYSSNGKVGNGQMTYFTEQVSKLNTRLEPFSQNYQIMKSVIPHQSSSRTTLTWPVSLHEPEDTKHCRLVNLWSLSHLVSGEGPLFRKCDSLDRKFLLSC